MTRDEAIDIRSRQLSGEEIDPAVLGEALALIALPAPVVKGKPGRKKGQRYWGVEAKTGRKLADPRGLLGAKARVNRVLLKNLRAKGVAVPA